MKIFKFTAILTIIILSFFSCGSDDDNSLCSADNPNGKCNNKNEVCISGICMLSEKKCDPECQEDEFCEDGKCSPLTKETDCKDESPENAESITEKVTITYDKNKKEWSEIPVCEWKCKDGYKLTSDEKRCILKQDSDYCKEIECIESQHAFCKVENQTPFCACEPGYKLNEDQKTCSDINECEENTSGCDQNCTNFEGGFECSCDEGYILGFDGKTCLDVNECLSNNGGCDENAECINKPGTFECICKSGYEGDGIECSVIDICNQTNNPCNEPHKTICKDEDHNGIAECYCENGYQLNENNICENINECDPDHLLANCNPNATCHDTEGSYECICNEGYEGDGIECNPI